MYLPERGFKIIVVSGMFSGIASGIPVKSNIYTPTGDIYEDSSKGYLYVAEKTVFLEKQAPFYM